MKWHFGNGPDNYPNSFQMSCEGLRQGDAPASQYFNVLIAKVYKKQIALLAGRGALFAVADDVKILGPPIVIAELAEGFPALAWKEAGLKTHSVKKRMFVQPSAQAGWNLIMCSTPCNSSSDLPVHDIPDGSESCDPPDPLSWRTWPLDDGVNIVGTPLGCPDFEAEYLSGKGLKHIFLLGFIKEVADAGFH